MKVSIVNPQRVAREVLRRGLATKLQAEVVDFPTLEDLFLSSMEYDVFIIYSNFGRMTSGEKGIKQVRDARPQAFIIGVSSVPNANRKMGPAGADAFLLRAGNELEELVNIIQKKYLAKKDAAKPTS